MAHEISPSTLLNTSILIVWRFYEIPSPSFDDTGMELNAESPRTSSIKPGRRCRGSNPLQKSLCRFKGGLDFHCATDAPSGEQIDIMPRASIPQRAHLPILQTVLRHPIFTSFSRMFGALMAQWVTNSPRKPHRPLYRRFELSADAKIDDDQTALNVSLIGEMG
ncbi:hypothetical protein PoB_006359200 [Plakobranchus ocellatus]|uniref:Uncharacterized protein n=1 Tax=Plakobranchus ocellatus TaxID=259542 RepID=A0AAV4CYR5_9GAST|nr:hypothetical protein PoB_006359200 [Plakobranchus ocellatus]